ncbi:MAG: ABC transporter ATP-binding protein [Chitinophagales bacterium]|nr:ABC transporter ATP-binding protein [Bacteroidota bacterium]MCB9043732.1 ABC transporter ATP-binding protein [Chitinophagales bacterium]
MNPTKRFWSLLKLYKKDVRYIYIYALFIGFINLTLPLGIQAIVNFLQTGEYTFTWLMLVGFVLFGILVSGVLQIFQLRVLENSQQDLFARSALEFAYRLPKIAYIQLDKIHAPELVNRFFDTLTIQKGVPKILIDFSLAIFQIFFGIILLTIYSPYFIILGMVWAFILWLIFRISGPRGLSTSLQESKYKYQLVHWLEETARVNRSFKIYSDYKFHLNKTDTITSKYIQAREHHFWVLLSQFRLFVGFKVIVAASLLLLGGWLVFKDQMNIGQFVAAEIVILLIISSTEKLLSTIDIIYDVLTALDKIGFVVDLALDEDTGIASLNTEQGLSIKATEIVLGFPEEKKKFFNYLSFEILANEKVVLSGKSGSGKSLLLQVLAGIYQIEDGELYINEIPVANYKKSEIYNSIGVSFAVNQLFEGTIKENILMGRDYDEKKMSNILQLLQLNDYIIHQSKGIDSSIESGGRRMPRSIIQKILIARLIINEPKLLLMEDPLQFIEHEEKKKIIDYIMDKNRNWTVLVVSDFYYWTEKCDRVINLSKI